MFIHASSASHLIKYPGESPAISGKPDDSPEVQDKDQQLVNHPERNSAKLAQGPNTTAMPGSPAAGTRLSTEPVDSIALMHPDLHPLALTKSEKSYETASRDVAREQVRVNASVPVGGVPPGLALTGKERELAVMQEKISAEKDIPIGLKSTSFVLSRPAPEAAAAA